MQIQFCTTIVTFCTPEAKNSDRIANILTYVIPHGAFRKNQKRQANLTTTGPYFSAKYSFLQNCQCNKFSVHTYIRIYDKILNASLHSFF